MGIFFHKEGNSTVKWTVTQYHAKNERAAPKTYSPNLPDVACIAVTKHYFDKKIIVLSLILD